MSRTANTLFVALLCAMMAIGDAWAYRVSPLIMSMELGRGQTTKRMTVTNPDAFDKAIVVTAHETTISLDGKRQMAQAEAPDLLVFPPQALVRPGATQTFVIQWLGDPALRTSKTYTIAFRQIDVGSAPRPGASIRVMVNLLTTLSVQPPGAEYPAIAARVDATGRAVAGTDGTPAIEMTVRNAGPFHAYVSDADIVFAAGGRSERLDANDVILKIGEGLVLPNSTRRFIVPVAPPGAGPIDIDLSFAERGFRGRR